MASTRLLIVTEGGTLQAVYSNEPDVEVALLNYDDCPDVREEDVDALMLRYPCDASVSRPLAWHQGSGPSGTPQ
jgi:hypothetical protein